MSMPHLDCPHSMLYSYNMYDLANWTIVFRPDVHGTVALREFFLRLVPRVASAVSPLSRRSYFSYQLNARNASQKMLPYINNHSQQDTETGVAFKQRIVVYRKNARCLTARVISSLDPNIGLCSNRHASAAQSSCGNILDRIGIPSEPYALWWARRCFFSATRWATRAS